MRERDRRRERGSVRLPLLLAILVTAAAVIAPRGSEVFEFWYREIVPRWAEVTRAVVSRAPFSLTSATVLALVLAALFWSWRAVRARRADGWRWLLPWAFVKPWIATVLWVYLVALFPWGVLHRRAPIEERRGWPELERNEIVAVLRREAADLARRTSSFDAPGASVGALDPRAAQLGLEAVRALDPALPIAPCGAREFAPRGALAALGVSGVFMPGWMEPHIEPSLTPPERYFSIAHEEAHRGGFTSEAEANLAAYLGLAGAPEAELRHAALVALLLHAQSALLDPRYGPPIEIPARAIEDARAAVARSRAQRWDRLARPASMLNDAYLRSSGDRGGVRSYGVFPELLARARASGF